MPSIKKALGASRVDGWPRGLFIVVAEMGLEPTQPQWPKDFKSFVSTIPPFGRNDWEDGLYPPTFFRRKFTLF